MQAIIGGEKDTWGFDPRILPGFYAWFDATDSNTVILDGSSNVSAWLDKSGNSRHLFQNTASNRPSYASNYVQCISGSQVLDTSGFPATSVEYTVACLSKPLTKADASDGRFGTLRSLYSPSTTNANFLSITNVVSSLLVTRNSGNNQINFTELTTCGGGGNVVLTMTMASARTATFTFNGSLLTAGGGVHANSSIAKIGNDPSGNMAWGEIQEILVFQPTLTQDFRKQVESYLAWKGGLGYMSTPTPAATPLNVASATCFQWFDASDATTVDLSGSTQWATRWQDKSGLGLDASQGNPATRVWYNPNGYMDFSGGKIFNMRRDISSYMVNKSFSMFVVANRKYQGTGYMIGSSGGGVGSNFAFGYSNSVTFIGTFWGGNQIIQIPYSYVTPSYNVSPETPTIWGLLYDLSTNRRSITSNGHVRSVDSPLPVGLVNLVTPFIGTANSTYNGHIYEIIMYSGQLSTQDESNVGSYLSRKWGINTNIITWTGANRQYPALSRNFIPTDISGIGVWFDAADPATVTLSGNNVTGWADKSGNSRNASTTSNWPTYTINSNFVQFGGSAWIGYDGNFLANTQHTLFFTVKRDVSKAEHIFMSSGTNNATNSNLVVGYSPNTFVLKYGYFANDTSFAVAGFTTAATEPINIICVQQTATQRLAWSNGIALGTNTNSTLVINNNDAILGAYRRSVSTALQGKMYEVNMFNRALSTAERQQMEGYLAWKWGLLSNLPVTHPYYSLPPAMTRFHPLMPAAPILWLDAQDRSTYDLSGDSYISSLVDKSGYKGTLTTTLGAGYRPGWISNGLNGYPCFTTDVSNPGRRLYGTYGTAARVSAQQYAVCCILTPESIVQNSSRIFSTQATTGDDFSSGGGFSMIVTTTPSSVAPYTLAAQRMPTRIRLSPATFSNVPTIFTISGTASAAGILLNWGLGLGVMFPNTGGGAMWQMRVGEVLVYRQSLDLQTLLRIEGYLAWKWGAQSALSNNHPYKNVRP